MHTVTPTILLLVHCDDDHRDLHSFPTRRSSDLSSLKQRMREHSLHNFNCGFQFFQRTSKNAAVRACKTDDDVALRVERNGGDRKSTRLNSSHVSISYAVFCLKKKTKIGIYGQ